MSLADPTSTGCSEPVVVEPAVLIPRSTGEVRNHHPYVMAPAASSAPKRGPTIHTGVVRSARSQPGPVGTENGPLGACGYLPVCDGPMTEAVLV